MIIQAQHCTKILFTELSLLESIKPNPVSPLTLLDQLTFPPLFRYSVEGVELRREAPDNRSVNVIFIRFGGNRSINIANKY